MHLKMDLNLEDTMRQNDTSEWKKASISLDFTKKPVISELASEAVFCVDLNVML